MESVLTNDQFVEYVINISKDVFSEREQRYMPKTKVIKLTVMVAEELEKDQVKIKDYYWAFYRHGFYSESANKYIKAKYGEYFHLNSTPKTLKIIPGKLTNLIKESILKFKNIFIQDRNHFSNWVYKVKTPREYRLFYAAHRTLLKWFNRFNIWFNRFSEDILNNFDKSIKGIISSYYESLEYIEDPEILLLFRKFTDLIEYTLIKMKHGKKSQKISVYFKNLKNIYEEYILNLLPPYLDTLKGDNEIIPEAVDSYHTKIAYFKKISEKQISKYYAIFEKEDLLPTFEEMQMELHNLAEGIPLEDRNVSKLYQDLVS